MAQPKRLFIVKVLILVAICLSGGSVFSFYSLLFEQNKKLEPTLVLIDKGESLNEIAVRLKKDELIKSVSVFKVAGRLAGQDKRVKAGEYRIPAKASAKMILDILVSGQTVVRSVMIPEGKTSQQIFDILRQTRGLDGDLPNVPVNGALLPETYRFSYGLPRRVIVQRMQEGANKTIDDLWEYRDPDLPYTTKNEVLTLASIVEKETALASERPRIAGVFVNRLRKGMRLQSDPTVIYAVTNGTMELKRPLTFTDLRQQNPYNTYTSKGLPPSPICNPGRDAILAVLRPIKTDEIYFVADGTGGHLFSKTFDQHKKNIANWKRTKREAKRKKARTKRAASVPVVEEIDTTVLSIEGDTTIVEDVIEAETQVKQTVKVPVVKQKKAPEKQELKKKPLPPSQKKNTPSKKQKKVL